MTFLYLVSFTRRRSPWPFGDWLINYQAGFVRRGLYGEITWHIASWLHAPLVTVAAIGVGVCVLCAFGSLWVLASNALRRGGPMWMYAMLLSPATLAFVWLNPTFALRKEIALYALLGIVAVLLIDDNKIGDAGLTMVLAIAFPLLLLVHEGMVCFLPYVFAVVALGRSSVKRAVRMAVVPALLCLIALLAVFHHTGDVVTARAICRSVGGDSTGLCYGPIWYIGFPRTGYAKEVAAVTHNWRLLAAFAVTAMLAMLPALMGLRYVMRRTESRSLRVVPAAAFAVAWLVSIVLFMQALDWSRWIAIHAMCLLFLLLLAEARRDKDSTVTGANTRVHWRTVIILVLYVACWNLPAIGQYTPFGYAAKIWQAAKHFAQPLNGTHA